MRFYLHPHFWLFTFFLKKEKDNPVPSARKSYGLFGFFHSVGRRPSFKPLIPLSLSDRLSFLDHRIFRFFFFSPTFSPHILFNFLCKMLLWFQETSKHYNIACLYNKRIACLGSWLSWDNPFGLSTSLVCCHPLLLFLKLSALQECRSENAQILFFW